MATNSSSKFPGDFDKAKLAVKGILNYLGEDPTREGLLETPERVVKSWDRLFGGYHQDPATILKTFTEQDAIPTGQIILLKNIEFYSTCEHHFMPFTGLAHVAYIPSDRLVGISKLARLVEVFSRRLQIQERIGNQVVESLVDIIKAQSAACIIEASHSCIACRGVEKKGASLTTSALRGGFMSDHRTRMELLTLIKG